MFDKLISGSLSNCGGKQSCLAGEMDITEGCLSKKMNGESGWSEKDINNLFRLSGLVAVNPLEHQKQIKALMTALQVVMNTFNGGN